MPKQSDYDMLPADKNCALQAFSKIYHKGCSELKTKFVDTKSYISSAKDLEFPKSIKKVLDGEGFTKVSLDPSVKNDNPSGAEWGVFRAALLKHYKNQGQFYAIWWGGKKQEDWNGNSEDDMHAFVIKMLDGHCTVRGGNIENFETDKLKADHCVSIWQPTVALRQ